MGEDVRTNLAAVTGHMGKRHLVLEIINKVGRSGVLRRK